MKHHDQADNYFCVNSTNLFMCYLCGKYYLLLQNLPPTPIMKAEMSRWLVMVDRQPVVATPVTTSTAVQLWFGAFWEFQLCYPERLKNTLLFIEKVFLTYKGKAPAVVSKWANRLMR